MDFEGHKQAGNKALKEGRFEEAINFYASALQLAKEPHEEAAVYSNKSLAYLRLGDAAKALELAEKATKASEDWPKGYFRKGEALAALGRHEDAVTALAHAAKLDPKDTFIARRIQEIRDEQHGFYFRQLSPGEDFCLQASNFIEQQVFSSAIQMKNFIYLVGDARTKECVVVDPAWDVKGIRRFVEKEGMRLVGVIVTHYHFDHTGGKPPPPFDAFGITVEGVRELAAEGLPVYVNEEDAGTVATNNQVPLNVMVKMKDDLTLTIGNVTVRFIHTPGHTPGSQCILIPKESSGRPQDMLLSGDTVFIRSCGRLDLPDCNAKRMYHSLQHKVAPLAPATIIFPGHNYGGLCTTVAKEKNEGLLRPISEADWMRSHGA
eukprot:jgi/Mesvir1/12565/Mv18451-RA.1